MVSKGGLAQFTIFEDAVAPCTRIQVPASSSHEDELIVDQENLPESRPVLSDAVTNLNRISGPRYCCPLLPLELGHNAVGMFSLHGTILKSGNLEVNKCNRKWCF